MLHLLTLALLFAIQTIYAQSVERWEYCQIYYQTGGFNSKTTVTVDYGDKTIKALGKVFVACKAPQKNFFQFSP